MRYENRRISTAATISLILVFALRAPLANADAGENVFGACIGVDRRIDASSQAGLLHGAQEAAEAPQTACQNPSPVGHPLDYGQAETVGEAFSAAVAIDDKEKRAEFISTLEKALSATLEGDKSRSDHLHECALHESQGTPLADSCRDYLLEKAKIRNLWSPMRVTLALSLRSPIRAGLGISNSSPQSIDGSPQHPFMTSTMPPLTPPELAWARKSLDAQLAVLSKAYDSADQAKKAAASPNASQKEEIGKQNYVRYEIESVYRVKAYEEYLGYIGQAGVLAYLSSPNPSSSELARAYAQIYRNAAKVLNRKEVSPLALIQFKPIVESVLSQPGGTRFCSVAQDLFDQAAHARTVRQLEKGAVLTVASLGCALTDGILLAVCASAIAADSVQDVLDASLAASRVESGTLASPDGTGVQTFSELEDAQGRARLEAAGAIATVAVGTGLGKATEAAAPTVARVARSTAKSTAQLGKEVLGRSNGYLPGERLFLVNRTHPEVFSWKRAAIDPFSEALRLKKGMSGSGSVLLGSFCPTRLLISKQPSSDGVFSILARNCFIPTMVMANAAQDLRERWDESMATYVNRTSLPDGVLVEAKRELVEIAAADPKSETTWSEVTVRGKSLVDMNYSDILGAAVANERVLKEWKVDTGDIERIPRFGELISLGVLGSVDEARRLSKLADMAYAKAASEPKTANLYVRFEAEFSKELENDPVFEKKTDDQRFLLLQLLNPEIRFGNQSDLELMHKILTDPKLGALRPMLQTGETMRALITARQSQ